jgi:hypothetical protein
VIAPKGSLPHLRKNRPARKRRPQQQLHPPKTVRPWEFPLWRGRMITEKGGLGSPPLRASPGKRRPPQSQSAITLCDIFRRNVAPTVALALSRPITPTSVGRCIVATGRGIGIWTKNYPPRRGRFVGPYLSMKYYFHIGGYRNVKATLIIALSASIAPVAAKSESDSSLSPARTSVSSMENVPTLLRTAKFHRLTRYIQVTNGQWCPDLSHSLSWEDLRSGLAGW